MFDWKKLPNPFRNNQYSDKTQIADLRALVEKLNHQMEELTQYIDAAYMPADSEFIPEADRVLIALKAAINQFDRGQRIRESGSSAQLLLERIGDNQGSAWLGADVASALGVRNAAYTVLLMQLTQAGQLRVPNQPAFFATDPQTGLASGTPLKFLSVEHNTGSHYAAATGLFTAPVDGLYAFDSNVFQLTPNSTSYGYIRLRKNDVSHHPTFHSQYQLSRSYENIYLHREIKLVAGDTIGIEYNGMGGATTYISNGYSMFSGHLIA